MGSEEKMKTGKGYSRTLHCMRDQCKFKTKKIGRKEVWGFCSSTLSVRQHKCQIILDNKRKLSLAMLR